MSSSIRRNTVTVSRMVFLAKLADYGVASLTTSVEDLASEVRSINPSRT